MRLFSLPERCTFCESVSAGTRFEAICDACLSRLPFRFGAMELPWHALGFARETNLAPSVICPLFYTDTVRERLLTLKFSGRRHAARAFGPLLAAFAARALGSVGAVLPMPLHSRRRRERGFNQAELIAQEAAASLDTVCLSELLSRTRATERQSETESREARRQNVAGAFSVDLPALDSTASCMRTKASAGRLPVLLLVDDVLTSGATLAEAANRLAAAVRGHNLSVATAVVASNALAPVRQHWRAGRPGGGTGQAKD